ncbi:hypothetical protein ACFRAQ_34605 [Nocardia sp. NPDC056611]|uniref:hypothetical protein n=1 Tax=Nocardia sp. NPDC056611 TaxID=3345877 RepID=UPI00366E1FDF
MATIKAHPQMWAISKGFLICDPDGWRNAYKRFDDLVTEDEFNKLRAGCTCATFGPAHLLSFLLQLDRVIAHLHEVGEVLVFEND